MTTRIGFQGFAAGADVVLSSDGEVGTTEPGGWPVQAQAGTQQSARIVMRRSQLQVAPEGINFEVVLDGFDTPGPASPGNPYDPQFHNIYYFWDFGDPGSVFTAPQNVPDVHKNANRGYGPLASHTYQRPGSYNPTCLVIEPSSGKTALASLRDEQGNPVSITVGDPDVLFAGDRTIFVSTDATFARAPAGARTVATPLAAYELQGTLQGSDPTKMYRIMFDREVQHQFVQNPGLLRPRSGYKNFYWCASPGSGTPEKVFCTNSGTAGFLEDETARSSSGKKTDMVFDGLNLDGFYDATTGINTGPNPSSQNEGQAFYNTFNTGFATHIMFNDVIANGFNTLVTRNQRHQDGPDTVDLIFNNTIVDSWANFAVFEDQQGFTSYTGCRFRQHPQALSGGVKNGAGNNTHGPIRIERGGKCVMHSSDLFSNNGWTEFPTGRGVHVSQPCVRWNQIGDPRGKLNMQGCALESGGRAIEMDLGGPSERTINNVILDKTAMVSGVYTADPVRVEHPGFTMRNCLLVQAGDRTLYGTAGVGSPISLAAFVPTGASFTAQEYLDAPVDIYSNTIINQISDAQAVGGDARVTAFSNQQNPPFGNVTFENNVYHQPNLTTPDIPSAPIGTAPLWEPRYDGRRDLGYLSKIFTLTADVPDGQTVLVPYTSWPGNRVQSDFEPSPATNAAHEAFINNTASAVSFSFDATGVTVTNNTGSTWLTGQEVRLNLATSGLPDFRSEYGTANHIVWSAVPQTGSTALGAAISGLTALDDFYGFARPQYPSIGAFEVVF
ncbi:MAG: hypothetical protein AAFU86_00155 [Pseudomonadota bacterium]